MTAISSFNFKNLRGGMASRQMSSDVSGEEKSEEEKAKIKVGCQISILHQKRYARAFSPRDERESCVRLVVHFLVTCLALCECIAICHIPPPSDPA